MFFLILSYQNSHKYYMVMLLCFLLNGKFAASQL